MIDMNQQAEAELYQVGCFKIQLICQINSPKLIMDVNISQDVPNFFLEFMNKNPVSASRYKI